MKLKHILPLFCLLICSCNHQEEPETYETVGKINDSLKGIYILNEGLFNMNNSSLTFVDAEKGIVQNNYFEKQNGRPIGDTANDIAIYGSKMYIIVNVSSTIEVTDLEAKSIKQIPLFSENGTPRQPRYIDFYEGKAYVTTFDGNVVKIDTTSLTVESITSVGRNPEGLCIADNKLYVANSGGLDYNNNIGFDNTISIVDLNTFTETEKITVNMNPYKVHSNQNNEVFVSSRGNYKDVNFAFLRINGNTVEETYPNVFPLNFILFDHLALIYEFNYSTSESSIYQYDLTSKQRIDWAPAELSSIKIPYGISVDETNGDIYITDSYNYTENGLVYCFTKDGQKRFSFEVGLNPNKVVFIKK